LPFGQLESRSVSVVTGALRPVAGALVVDRPHPAHNPGSLSETVASCCLPTEHLDLKSSDSEGTIMGRLVRKQKLDVDFGIIGLEEDIFVSDGAGNHVAKAEPGDGYLERVVKYVPAEIVACSMIINAILDQAVKNGGPNALMAGLPVTMIAWAALLVAMILTPIFCWYVQKDGDAWIANAVVSTLAFPFWAYLMGAVEFADFHDGNLAVILLLAFTAVSGLITPRARKPNRREVQQIASGRPRAIDTSGWLRDRLRELFDSEARASNAAWRRDEPHDAAA
jgi:hypothetical protein